MPSALRPWVAPWLFGKPIDANEPFGDHATVVATGWPMFALVAVEDTPLNSTSGWRYGYLPDPSQRTRRVGEFNYRGPMPIVLPYRPLWLGFTVNTLLAAALWLPLLMLPGAIYRRLTHPAWACRRCGYDRRGLSVDAPCPECGHAAKTPSSPA